MKFATLILLTVFLSSVRLCWCWVSSAPGDPPEVPCEFQEFAGLRGGLLVLGWQDKNVRGGLDAAMAAPRFHPWFVQAGWFDFGISGLPVWQAVLGVVLLSRGARWLFLRACFPRGAGA